MRDVRPRFEDQRFSEFTLSVHIKGNGDLGDGRKLQLQESIKMEYICVFCFCKVSEWLGLSPHSKKVCGSNPCQTEAFLSEVCMVSPCLHGFSLGTPTTYMSLADGDSLIVPNELSVV